MPKSNYILGIDTSCDDTSMAVLDLTTGQVLSNIVSSQIEIHAQHGGIVPELASRAHIENLDIVFESCLKKAGVKLCDLSAIAVTSAPGLIGCLLIGTSFARALAYRLKIPLYGINHLHGHLFSPFIGKKNILYPFLGLVVSGGHTAFYHVTSPQDITVVGQTVDDAAGEAFDKIAMMMKLGYPGGPVIDKLARDGDPHGFKFTPAKVKLGPEYMSFSGLKTAAYLEIQNLDLKNSQTVKDLCASVQNTIVKSLTGKLEYLISHGAQHTAHSVPRAFVLSGGVAMNSVLRRECASVCGRLGLDYFMAKPEYCTDNGAMIAFRAMLGGLEDELYSLSTLATKKMPLCRGILRDTHKLSGGSRTAPT